MSTKIYNGHRLEPMGFSELVRLCLSVIPAAEASRSALIRQFYKDRINYHAMRPRLQERAWTSERMGVRDPLADFSFNATFIPIENNILFIPFCDHSQIVETLTSCAQFFGYWDNSDKDERCSEIEWKERGRLWGMALGDDGIPSKHGLTFTFLDYRLPFEFEVFE